MHIGKNKVEVNLWNQCHGGINGIYYFTGIFNWNIIDFYWNTVDLQCYVSFCCPARWFSYICICLPIICMGFPGDTGVHLPTHES